MIRYDNGTVFNANTDAIVNTVNCDGFMGAGIALEFGLRYPDMLKEYVEKCRTNKIIIGSVDYYKDVSGITIVNFPTKIHFKYPSRIQWIEKGLKSFAVGHKEYGFESVAFPKLGTAKGGLDWNVVKALMEKYLQPLNLDVVICLDELKEAYGIEKEMLDMFNSSSVDILSSITRLTKKQRDILSEGKPYNRFWEIGREKGIGKKTYEHLFKFFYLEAKNDTSEEQISFSF